MNINEYYQPKISKGIEKVALNYYNKLHQDNYFKIDADNLLRKKLSKYGWKFLNTGVFSQVFVNPNKNFVLKINSNPDIGYASYVALIKHYKNPHFPIISDMKKIIIGDANFKKTYYIYLIEKLYPYKNYENNKIFNAVSENSKLPLSQIFKKEKIPPILLSHPKLVKALQIIGNYDDTNDIIYLDLHTGNIMQRNDGTIVITDPYSSYF
jgi:hypothetical protein